MLSSQHPASPNPAPPNPAPSQRRKLAGSPQTHTRFSTQFSNGASWSIPTIACQAGLTFKNVPSSAWRERPTAQVSDRMASSVWSWASRACEAETMAFCSSMLRGGLRPCQRRRGGGGGRMRDSLLEVAAVPLHHALDDDGLDYAHPVLLLIAHQPPPLALVAPQRCPHSAQRLAPCRRGEFGCPTSRWIRPGRVRSSCAKLGSLA